MHKIVSYRKNYSKQLFARSDAKIMLFISPATVFVDFFSKKLCFYCKFMFLRGFYIII